MGYGGVWCFVGESWFHWCGSPHIETRGNPIGRWNRAYSYEPFMENRDQPWRQPSRGRRRWVGAIRGGVGFVVGGLRG